MGYKLLHLKSKETFDEIWAYVEMLDQFGMIDIDVEIFPIDSVDETY